MKIAVVGGGPAGLFSARLMKLRRPADEIRVFEQNPVNATYGLKRHAGWPRAQPAPGSPRICTIVWSAEMHFNTSRTSCSNASAFTSSTRPKAVRSRA